MEDAVRIERERRGQEPSASGMLMVVVLVVAGSTTMWGAFSWHGLVLMVAATGLAMWLHVRPGWEGLSTERLLAGMVIAFIAAGCCLTSGQYQTRMPYVLETLAGVRATKVRLDGFGLAIRFLGVGALMASVGYLLRLRARMMRCVFGVLVAAAVAMRVLMLGSSPSPMIDVFVSQTLGAKGVVLALTPEGEQEEWVRANARSGAEAETLRESRNVYSMRFPSPYFRGRTFDHYGYPPATVYVNVLSWAALKDVRGGWLICDLIAAWCIYLVARRTGPGRRRFAELVALAFLFLPRSLFVLEQSWTEPLALATLGVLSVLLAGRNGPVLRGVVIGLFFSSKQYMALALPFLLKLRRCRAGAWAAAVVTGVVLAAPFALWGWGAMYHDVFGFFVGSPGRPDALSMYGAVRRFGYEIPWWVVVPLWLAGVGFFTWKMKRTLGGMLFSLASAWLFFFMLGKQAFMNYWHLILFALLLAVAGSGGWRVNDCSGE